MKSSHSAGNTYFFLTFEAKRFEVFALGGKYLLFLDNCGEKV